jgi:hypothetical protein
VWLEIKNARDLEKTKEPQHNYWAKSKRLLQGEKASFKGLKDSPTSENRETYNF